MNLRGGRHERRQLGELREEAVRLATLTKTRPHTCGASRASTSSIEPDKGVDPQGSFELPSGQGGRTGSLRPTLDRAGGRDYGFVYQAPQFPPDLKVFPLSL